MDEQQAKTHLTDMLQSYTAGSVLHLLADLYQDSAEQARQDGDAVLYRQCKTVEYALIVVGMGIDAACPS